jgi:pentatricopeptide repeat protein
MEEQLAGYRGMGPVRVGNQAHEHLQHDVYGNVVLAAHQTFIDERLLRPAGVNDFRRLEAVGERAFMLHNEPDAGMWELRTRASVHTSSSLMCWAACDRLAHIAGHMEIDDRAAYWADRAATIKETIVNNAWNNNLGSFAATFGGDEIDASLLLMIEVGLLSPDDPRFIATVAKVEEQLKRGKYLMRYNLPDDFGAPENAFNICTFWYIEALSAMGRVDEARDIFENMLARRNHLGLLSEDLDISTGEAWGNFPQTYSLVGIINSAIRLTRRWEETL